MRFRWVVLQLAELEKCSSRYEIDKQLAELPKGLDEIYNRILKNIDEKHRADTRTFLQWLAFCNRPMTIKEIAETITVDLSSEKCPVFNQDKRYTDPRDVVDLYGHVGQDVESRDYAYTIYSPLHRVISSVVFLFLTLRM